MEEIHVEDEYTIICMRFLISMKACIATIAQGTNNPDIAELDSIIAQNPHLAPQLTRFRQKFLENIARRIEACYSSHLVVTPYLEVNDVSSAEYARYLRDCCGWTGTACYDENLDENLGNDIRNALCLVPCRVKRVLENGQIVLVLPPPPGHAQQHP